MCSFIALPGCMSIFKKDRGPSMINSNLKKIIHHQVPHEQHWVGDGFHVHTMMQPHPNTYPMTSPFILMDYAPPRNFSSSTKQKGVGEHPHRGFETVTFAYQGEITHRDSAGGGGTIGQGDVQWMTAASGVVHEELHSKDFSSRGGEFEMVQLWVNLPKNKKMAAPRYQGIKDKEFPRFSLSKNCEGRLIAGEMQNKNGPCLSHSPINVFDLTFNQTDDIEINLKKGTNTVIFVLRGQIELENKSYSEKNLLAFSRDGELIKLNAKASTKILVLNGDPIDEPIFAYGPFVMNTRDEIIEAINDYQSGKMGHL